jgi:SAM-dependent methyltransferase
VSDITPAYDGKAAAYAQFRWRYAPEAIERVCDEGGLAPGRHVADIGAGPGSLTSGFVERQLEVWAVEPNAEMRAVAEERLGRHANFHSVAATAESTSLPAASIDLIVVGRALHWFAPEPTRAEFRRILKVNGWLAVFAIRCVDRALDAAMDRLTVERHGFVAAHTRRCRAAVDLPFFVGSPHILEWHFRGIQLEHWPEFIGRLTSLSGAPNRESPTFGLLERAAEEVFQQFAVGGRLEIPIETQVWLGQMA